MTQNTKAKLAMFAFLAVCAVPAVTMFTLPPQKPAANQILSEKPSIFLKDGKFNTKVLNDTTKYVADHLGLRQEIITVNNTINAKIFKVSMQDKVVLGKDDWLFYTETMDDYLNTNKMSDGELFSIARTLSLMTEYANNQGANLYFTVAPNKATLYPEFLYNMGKPIDGEHNLQSLIKWLSSENVAYIDLLTPLKNDKNILYYHTDSHWTELGAGLAHDVIINAVGKTDQTPFYLGETKLGDDKLGDLYTMLYPSGTYKEKNLVYTRDFEFSYTKPMRSYEDQQIQTRSNKSGSLLMFRDSFGNSLYSYLADAYGSALFSRAMPYNMSMLEQYNADTIIIEICERNLNWLSAKAPILKAPLRFLSGTPQIKNIDVNVYMQKDEQISGYVRLEGTIKGKIDKTTPVYIQLAENLYEASPVGDRSNGIPFVLYVPETEINGQASIIYQFNDNIYQSQYINIS